MEEAWRPVVGYEQTYEVSSEGRVRRTAPGKSTRPGRMLKLRFRNGGGKKPRASVGLCQGGVERPFDVHRLVALAFLGPRPAGLEINHIDGDASNNRASNLEYCTRSENMAHAYRLGLSHQFGIGEDQTLAKLTSEQIIVIRHCTAPVRLMARVFGVTPITIKRARVGLTWKHVR